MSFSESYCSADNWMALDGPESDVVVSSRARLARNMDNYKFPVFADEGTLKQIASAIEKAVFKNPFFAEYVMINLSVLRSLEKCYLRESRLISKEFEQEGASKLLFLSPDRNTSIMINEEDHIRMQTILSGFQLDKVFNTIIEIDKNLASCINYSWSDRYGYLTSCPTNTGTGLRLSLLLHLPGLAMLGEVENLIAFVAPYGMTMRGFDGENSENIGDFYQLSNEVTMGKKEQEILENLKSIFSEILGREKKARELLLRNKSEEIDDRIWRSYAILSHARKIDSTEAMGLLSMIRLGIERGYFKGIDHHFLNQLVTNIQPGHIQWKQGGEQDIEKRDRTRAEILREVFKGFSEKN